MRSIVEFEQDLEVIFMSFGYSGEVVESETIRLEQINKNRSTYVVKVPE